MGRVKKEKIQDQTVTCDALATMLGLSARRIQQLAKDDIVKKNERGRYLLIQSIQGYVEFIKIGGYDVSPHDLKRQKVRLTKANADRAEMEAAVMKGSLIPNEVVKAFWAEMVTAFKSSALSLPVKLAPQISGESNLDSVKAILTRGIHESLQEIADYDARKIVRSALQEYSADGSTAA